ncbi:MAG: M81 family metallopeptidase [Anaerorhabdus sp.]
MKILIGSFTTESNANAVNKNEITAYDFGFEADCIRKMGMGDYFEKLDSDIEIIPALYTSGRASGVISRKTFKYIEACFVEKVLEHKEDIDGIFLYLHGASEVEGLGSGDHHILKKVRDIVGPYLPICVACDPHGNLKREYVESTQVIRSFRESPHIDAKETKIKVINMLIDLLKNRQNVHAIYRKLPLILGGEQSVSADEPVRSINKKLEEIEQDPRIRSCSWHVGYLRHDTPVAGCGIVVCPQTETDQKYAEKVADELYEYVWSKRHEFHYTGVTAKPEEALDIALEKIGKPVFITDSGDNTTSGAPGTNTFILRQVMSRNSTSKSFLFANICDPKTFLKLYQEEVGTVHTVNLGINKDELSKSVELNVTIKKKGELRGYMVQDPNSVPGYSVLVSVMGMNVDINIASDRTPMCEKHQFVAGGIDWDEYDIIVVKQGYIFPDLEEKGVFSVMSLTDGATPQDTENIRFKLINRPMFPIDKI